MTTINQEDFAIGHRHEQQTLPERLQDDGLVQYFRSRYSTRKELMSSFDTHETERVKSELFRIERLRKHFRVSERHKSDMDTLGRSLANWKQAARIEAEKDIKILISEIKSLQDKINQGMNGDERTVAEDMSKLDPKIKLYKGLKSLLPKLIPDRNQDPEEPQQNVNCLPAPGTNSQLDSDFGFTVSTVTLEKDSLSSSYTKFSMEKFALNNILHGGGPGQRDPLKEKQKPNTLRYFHFPANNMIWVREISKINFHICGVLFGGSSKSNCLLCNVYHP